MIDHANRNRRRPHPDHRRPHRVRAQVPRLPREPARNRAAYAGLQGGPCAARCARIRTLSSWARCATTKPSPWPWKRRKRATSCSRPCTHVSAVKTIDRIIEVFPEDMQAQVRSSFADSFKAVISQTLMKRADGKGRVAGLEILRGTPAVRNLIRKGENHQIPSVMQTNRHLGMQPSGRPHPRAAGKGAHRPGNRPADMPWTAVNSRTAAGTRSRIRGGFARCGQSSSTPWWRRS